MRKYAPLYLNCVWMVIYQDENETEWYIHVPNAGSMENANQIARFTTSAQESY